MNSARYPSLRTGSSVRNVVNDDENGSQNTARRDVDNTSNGGYGDNLIWELGRRHWGMGRSSATQREGAVEVQRRGRRAG